MPTLFQINECANNGSHGRIAEKLGIKAIEHGWDSYIAYGRYSNPSKSHLIRVGNSWSVRWAGFQSRLFDNHGLASVSPTRRLVDQMKEIRPDIVHLHNIHGYYLNYPVLFQYLKETGIPVVWTLHDCWTMTGHCAHFEMAKCNKWKEYCFDCPILDSYPASLFIDRSSRNYRLKKDVFTSINNLTIVPVSYWLESIVRESFLNKSNICTIQNGIDTDVFKPKENKRTNDKMVVLGVASVWYDTKGIAEFIKLSEDENYQVVMVGVDDKLKKKLPSNIKCIRRTQNIHELVDLYSSADIFLNPTYNDTFPTVNLEAMACGTPVVTYNTGGSPETLREEGGWVVEKGNFEEMKSVIDGYRELPEADKTIKRQKCVEIASSFFRESDCYNKYWELYNSLI